jgi:Ser/Thr protein kinase RdoA (MazF antagonist)
MTDQRPTTATTAGADAVNSAGGSVSGLSAIGSTPVDVEGRSLFAADELAIVLSHYRIGLIDTIKQFNRGSRKAPKLVIRSDHGLFLLKRRAHGRDDPFKVAFTHGIQLKLAERGYPLPRLIGTRRENNSMVQYLGQVYELFEFMRGTGYDRSVQATEDAGVTLARFHTLLADHKPHFKPPKGTYHAAPVVISSLGVLAGALLKPAEGEPTVDDDGARQIADELGRYYGEAADRADALGLSKLPVQVGHSDWHPGNMLFDGHKVVAVIDYDAARLLPRVIDIANGALQFSIQGRGGDTGRWPEQVDEDRYKAFFQGYVSVQGCELTPIEKQTVPWLMIQALIAESVIPVAATGLFAKMSGADFLTMVLRKVRWIEEHQERLIGIIDG